MMLMEEWEIWKEKEKVKESKEETKKLVSKFFYKWPKVFGKKKVRKCSPKSMRSCKYIIL